VSQVALLALAAMGPSQGIPPYATLVLPVLFAGGMSLVDTIDGMVMSWAYKSAASDPAGRQVYNLTLTLASSVIAISVGVVELLGCAQEHLELHGAGWDAVAWLNDNFEYVGYFVIGFFAASMLAALCAYACPRRPALSACAPSAAAAKLGAAVGISSSV
jgi:high-affinity nickel-transport protein